MQTNKSRTSGVSCAASMSTNIHQQEVQGFNSPEHLPNKLKSYLLPSAKQKYKTLGVGAYGKVELLEVDGAVCAGKSIHAALLEAGNEGVKNLIERFIQECELLSTLRHPQIVEFLGVCFLPPGSRIPMLVMEYMQASLDDLLESTPDIAIGVKRSLLQDVAKGLSFLHDFEPAVIHRDLTAKNILLNGDMEAKIADLGVARILNIQPGNLQTTLTRVPGTIAYMPPEAFSHYTVYSTSIDIFSLGHLMLYTITQVFPSVVAATYVDRDGRVMALTEVERRADTMAKMQEQLGETHPFNSLITRCLSNRPDDRPSAKEVLQNLMDMEPELPDPYAGMTKLNLIQQVAKKETKLQQQAEELRRTREEAERLQNTLAELTRQLQELTNPQLTQQAPSQGDEAVKLVIQKIETMKGEETKNHEDMDADTDEYIRIVPDAVSLRSTSNSPCPDDYMIPISRDSKSPSSTGTPELTPEDGYSSDECEQYEPPPDYDPSEPKRAKHQKPFLTYVQLKPHILYFLKNNAGGRIPGVSYNLQKNSVRIEHETMQLVHQSAARFQQVYRHVLQSAEFRVTDITVPPGVDSTWIEHILVYLKAKTPRSTIVYERAHSVLRLATLSNTDFSFLRHFLPLAMRNITPIVHMRPVHISMHVHHMSHERKLTLKKSNIGGEDVHVIVNTVNSELKLKSGLGAWLNHLSLGGLQKQCDLYRRQHGPMPLGSVSMVGLPPGARGVLKCDRIINTVTPTTAQNELAFRKMLSKIIRDVVTLAESTSAESIAIPPLSADLECTGVSRHLVASVMISELLTFKNYKQNCLTDIRIVTAEEDTYSNLVHYMQLKEGKRASLFK